MFFHTDIPIQSNFCAQNFNSDISELSRDHSKVHWKQSTDTHGMGDCYLVKKGLGTLQGESGRPAGSRAQPSTLKQISGRLYPAHPCWTLGVGLCKPRKFQFQLKCLVSGQPPKGEMGQSLEKKGLVKRKPNLTLRTPLTGETFPHDKLTNFLPQF